MKFATRNEESNRKIKSDPPLRVANIFVIGCEVLFIVAEAKDTTQNNDHKVFKIFTESRTLPQWKTLQQIERVHSVSIATCGSGSVGEFPGDFSSTGTSTAAAGAPRRSSP